MLKYRLIVHLSPFTDTLAISCTNRADTAFGYGTNECGGNHDKIAPKIVCVNDGRCCVNLHHSKRRALSFFTRNIQARCT